jgi:hypothetical protein
MTRGANEGCWFIEVSWGFHGLLIYFIVFLMLRWMMLEKVLGEDAS